MTIGYINLSAQAVAAEQCGDFAEAVKLAEAWGFKVKTMKGFTWVKLNQLAEQHINKALAAGEITGVAIVK